MVRRIHKQEMTVSNQVMEYAIPKDAKIVHVALQHGRTLTIWYEFEDRGEWDTRKFSVHSTGQPIPEGCEYVGTAVGELFVGHVYEVK